jgi:membrane dipeptidase
MLLFDAHLDLALNAVDWNRDLRTSLADLQVQERQLGMTDPGRGRATITLPEMKKGDVHLGIATLLARQEPQVNHTFGYITYEACYAIAHAHLAYYRAMERNGWMKMIRTKSDLTQHVRACHSALETGLTDRLPFGYILSMECGDAVLEPELISEWYDLGLRAIGITHYGTNRYGGGTRSEVGITSEGVKLLEHMRGLSMALDMTHLSDRAFWQVADLYDGRVLASHQNARHFCDWQRQFSDAQLKHVIRQQGVIGAALDAIMLQPGWVRGVSKPEVTMERVVDNIDHVCQLAGNHLHAGIGSDLDGGYGYEQTPLDVQSIAHLQHIPELLAKRGYSDEAIRAIMHGNWIRFFSEVLPD